jgi:hypothetical protein
MCPDLFILHNRFGKISTRIHENKANICIKANICGKEQELCKKCQKQVLKKRHLREKTIVILGFFGSFFKYTANMKDIPSRC